MERTARLVRIARARLASTPDAWLRGAAEVGKSVGASWHQSPQAAGGAGGGSGDEISGRDGACTFVEKDGVVGRAAKGTKLRGLVRSRATGPGSGLSFVTSPLTKGNGSGAPPHPSQLSPGERAWKEAGGGHYPLSGRKRAHNEGGSGCEVADGILQAGGAPGRELAVQEGERKGADLRTDELQAGGAPGRELPVQEGERKGADLRTDELAEASLREVKTKGGDFRPSQASDSSTHASAKVCPLTIHDQEYVPCDLISEDGNTALDVSDRITSLLIKSVGPISSFRIDSSRWPTESCLEKWVDRLSEKSVEEIDILNLGHKPSTVFPIQNLQSQNLKMLRLGFFSVDLDLLCFNYTSLRVLEFFCCTLESRKLSWIVTDCTSLQKLKVSYCAVDIHINSKSLNSLHSVGNTGNRIVITSAPNLLFLVCDIIPHQKSVLVRQRVSASISLKDVPKLESVNHLNLLYHKITVHSKDITKVVRFLPSVTKMMLGLEMSDVSQLLSLLQLLAAVFPQAPGFISQGRRMDSIGQEEGLFHPFDEITIDGCVKTSLTSLTMLDFLGGRSERLIIKSILKSAPILVELRTFNSESCLKRTVREAFREIKNYDRLSGGCKLCFE